MDPKNWEKIRVNYTGRTPQGVIFEQQAQMGMEQRQQWTAVADAVRTVFRRRADYGHLGSIKKQ